MRKEYLIAGIRISIDTVQELKDSAEYVLYRSELQEIDDQEEERYEICLVEDTMLPRTEGRVLFRNEMNLYIEQNGATLHFFYIPLTMEASAWCETTGKRSLTIHYSEMARDYFSETFGCFNASAFENILYTYKKFIYHCSYIDVGGEAVLFSAHSGGGKTTQGLLWEKYGLGEMINGDRAVLEKIYEPVGEKDYVVHGLPIAGSSNVFKNRSLPLKAIFIIEKAQVNEVVNLDPVTQFMKVFEQMTMHTWDKEFVNATVEFVEELIGNVPVRLLRCRPDEGAVYAVRESLE